jgi:hypothetical protein
MKHIGLPLLAGTAALVCAVNPAQAADKKPNIVVIMGDDVGIWNIGGSSPEINLVLFWPCQRHGDCFWLCV